LGQEEVTGRLLRSLDAIRSKVPKGGLVEGVSRLYRRQAKEIPDVASLIRATLAATSCQKGRAGGVAQRGGLVDASRRR